MDNNCIYNRIDSIVLHFIFEIINAFFFNNTSYFSGIKSEQLLILYEIHIVILHSKY